VDYSGQAYDAMLRSALRGEARDSARPRLAWEEPPRCGLRASAAALSKPHQAALQRRMLHAGTGRTYRLCVVRS